MENTNTQEVKQEEIADKGAYLQQMAGELMADTEWEFPQQQRFFLVADLFWNLLAL